MAAHYRLLDLLGVGELLTIRRSLGPHAAQSFRLAMWIRYLLHAHLFTPVFGLVMLLPVQLSPWIRPPLRPPTVAILFALGSLGFVLCKRLFVGHADRHGVSTAIKRGVICASVSTFATAALLALLRYDVIGSAAGLIGIACCQISLGFGLAFVDGPDRDLLMIAAGERGPQGSAARQTTIRQNDWALRTAGIATGALLGSLLFGVVQLITHEASMVSDGAGGHEIRLAGPVGLAGTAVFAATALLQLTTLRLTRRLSAREPAMTLRRTSTGARLARTIGAAARQTLREDRELGGLVVLIALVDGWLVFLTSLLSVTALKQLAQNLQHTGHLFADYALAAGIALAFWILGAVPLIGNYCFRRSTRNGAASGGGGAGEPALLPALQVIALAMAALTVYLVASAVAAWQHWSGVGLSLNLCMVILVSALRGYSQPLLYARMDECATVRHAGRMLTLRDIAGGRARLIQLTTAFLSVFVAVLLIANGKTGNSIVRDALTVSGGIMILFLLYIGVWLDPVAARLKRPTALLEDIRAAITRSRRVVGVTHAAYCVDRLLKDVWVTITGSGRAVGFACGFGICLIAANMLGARLQSLPPGSRHADLVFNWGGILYAAAFLFVGLCVEFVGRSAALRLYAVGIAASVVGALALAGEEFVVGKRPEWTSVWVFFGSAISMAVALLLDVSIYSTLKRLSAGRRLWVRVVIAGFVSQAVDTMIFVPIALVAIQEDLTFAYLAGQTLVKWAVVIAGIPLFYLARVVCGRRSSDIRLEELEGPLVVTRASVSHEWLHAVHDSGRT